MNGFLKGHPRTVLVIIAVSGTVLGQLALRHPDFWWLKIVAIATIIVLVPYVAWVMWPMFRKQEEQRPTAPRPPLEDDSRTRPFSE